MKVKGAEELGKRWEILGLVQGGGKDKLGYCNKFLLARGILRRWRGLRIQGYTFFGQWEFTQKWKGYGWVVNGEMSGGKGFTTRDVLPWGRWEWVGAAAGGFWSIIGSRYRKANGYTL